LAGHAAGWSAALPAFVALALVATPLLLVDARDHRLPDRLVLPAAGAALALLSLAASVRGDWAALGRAVAAAGVVFAMFCAAAVVSPSSLGFGDVKLSGLLALYLGWLGWGHVFYGIFAGFVLGALVAVVMLASRRVSLKSQIALGPALITGALLIAAVH
jgi:leader peptidase (prepilin peptidase) / N-methyltransferase